MCPYPKMTRKKGYMGKKMLYQLIDESAANGTKEMWLYMYGEPMLDQGLGEKIKYAKQKGIPITYLSTNGSLLDEKKAQMIFDSGLDRITISFDGTTKETYEKVRVNLNFEKTLQNTETLLKLKKEKGLKKPEITLQIIKMNNTNREIKAFVNKWKNYADVLDIKQVHDFAGQVEIETNKGNWAVGLDKHDLPRLPCAWLWYKAIVLQNGDVVICCFDYDGKVIVGNIKDTSMKEIWNSPKMKAIRRLHLKRDFGKIPLCNNCTAYQDIDPKIRTKAYLNYLTFGLYKDNLKLND